MANLGEEFGSARQLEWAQVVRSDWAPVWALVQPSRRTPILLTNKFKSEFWESSSRGPRCVCQTPHSYLCFFPFVPSPVSVEWNCLHHLHRAVTSPGFWTAHLLLSVWLLSVMAHSPTTQFISYSCSTCGQKCRSIGGLTRHRRSMHAVELTPKESSKYKQICHCHLSGALLFINFAIFLKFIHI